VLITSYGSLYGGVHYGPIFINGDFKYWTQDAEHGGMKPYCWQIDQSRSDNDSIRIYRTEVDGQRCVGVYLYQDGEDSINPWVSVHIRQEVRGLVLHELFCSKIGIWVYLNTSYIFDEVTMKPKNAFGIEVNDGENLIWFIFSDGEEMAYALPHHRIVVSKAPLREWSYHEVDVMAEYKKSTNKQLDSISIILLMGVSKDCPGRYQGYFSNVTAVYSTNRLP